MFNTIINTLVRNVDYAWRVVIALAFLFLAFFSLVKSIRRKNDSNPLAYGWFVLCLLSMALSMVYFFV